MLSRNSKTRLALVATTTIALMLLVWYLGPLIAAWQRGELAAQLAQQVAENTDASVKVPLRQLASLGIPALDPLVVAAASQRATVSAIARQILDEKLAAWMLLAEVATSETVDREFIDSTTTLAKALADHIDMFGPAGKQWAERLAMALIKLADALPAQPSGALLTDCSRILASVPPRGPRMRTVTTRIAPSTAHASVALATAQPRLEPLTRASEGSLEVLARLQPRSTLEIQGGLPQPQRPNGEAVDNPTKPPATAPVWSKPQPTNAGQPTPLPTATVALPIDPFQQRDKVKSRVTDIPTPQEMQDRAATLRQLFSEDLLVHLRGASFFEAGIIRAELIDRGYTSAELTLIQRLTLPKAADRLRLVEDASALPAAAARRLLRRLLDDQNADVRLRALTALATTNAPNLSQLARELALRDEDPRVAELASRLMRKVR